MQGMQSEYSGGERVSGFSRTLEYIAGAYDEDKLDKAVRGEKALNLLFENPLTKQAATIFPTQPSGVQAGLSTAMKGRAWTYLEGSFHFAKSVFEALVLIVRDFAIALFSLPLAIFSSQARDALETHAKLLLADIASLPIGIIGFISPHAGSFLASAAAKIFIKSLIPKSDHGDMEKLLKGKEHKRLHVSVVLTGMQAKLHALMEELEGAEQEDKQPLQERIKEHYQAMVDYAHLHNEHREVEKGPDMIKMPTSFANLLNEEPSEDVAKIVEQRAEAKAERRREKEAQLQSEDVE